MFDKAQAPMLGTSPSENSKPPLTNISLQEQQSAINEYEQILGSLKCIAGRVIGISVAPQSDSAQTAHPERSGLAGAIQDRTDQLRELNNTLSNLINILGEHI